MEQRQVIGRVNMANGDDTLERAIAQARASIGIFLQAFWNPKPSQGGFHMKVRFERDGQLEYIWLAELDLGTRPGRRASGVVANDTRLEGFPFGARVEFDKSAVTDWMFSQDGELVGGYTTKVLLQMRKRYEGERAMSKLHHKFGTKKLVLQ